MQTFLPFESFIESAHALDNRRLQKQIVECKQIYLSLTVPDYGWKNHPAVKMWKGYEDCLLTYMFLCILAWESRFKKEHSLFFWPIQRCPRFVQDGDDNRPPWLGRKEFHDSHKSNLYRKDPEYYKQFADVGPDLPYFWPTKEGY